MTAFESKVCVTCGRTIEYRKKWAKNWDEVRYCSDGCRKNKVKDDYEAQILELLALRGRDKTICPSEILSDDEKQDKLVMEKVRAAARRLVAKGRIAILQKGQVVEPSTAKGPIRLKLTSSS